MASVHPTGSAARRSGADAATAEAWSTFWDAQGPGSRCLARSPELDVHWHSFARTVWPTITILDVGCGAGAVGHALHMAEPRLQVIGIDVAQVPGTLNPRLQMLSGISMEALPFPDASLGAAVSQFGFEYGNTEAAADELARVLVPGSPLSLLIHHPEGPIVDDMRRHRRAIEGLCGLRIQAAFFSGNEIALAEHIAALKAKCSNDSIVEQTARGLISHITRDEPQRLRLWKAIIEALEPELVMLESLGLSSTVDQSIDTFAKPLGRSFDLQPVRILETRLGDPIAWIIEGRRRA